MSLSLQPDGLSVKNAYGNFKRRYLKKKSFKKSQKSGTTSYAVEKAKKYFLT